MATSIAEAMDTATDELRLSRLALDAARAVLTDKAGQAQTVINNFVSRPMTAEVWVDEISGNDDNDGKSSAKPKKNIDLVLAAIGSQSTAIQLLSDVTVKMRHTLYTSVLFSGKQPANNALGYTYVRRQVKFLGLAINAPLGEFGNLPSGFFLGTGAGVTSFSVDFKLPDVPAGYPTRSFVTASGTSTVNMISATITADATAAGPLFGSFNGNRMTVGSSLTLGANVSGKVFEGVAAGANPNSLWVYDTSITAG